MVDLRQPEGPTSATNSPSAIRSVVFESAGTARCPRPKVTEVSDSSIAIGPAAAETDAPANSELGCMRIMEPSACKRNASKTRPWNQRYREETLKPADSICAIGPTNCMQFRRSIVGHLCYQG